MPTRLTRTRQLKTYKDVVNTYRQSLTKRLHYIGRVYRRYWVVTIVLVVVFSMEMREGG